MLQRITVKRAAKFFILSSLVISLFIVIAGAFIMTDAGQVFGISKSIIVYYFKSSNWLFFISFVFIAIALYMNYRNKLIKNWLIITLTAIWLIALLSAKYATPYFMFRSQQHTSEYMSIAEAQKFLKADDVVYVVDYNGEAKAFPRKMIWQPHIIGGDYNGEDIVFTYCVLTNLPSPYKNELNGEEMNLRVLAQTNNNLLLWDTESNEIIQQIENKTEFGQTELDPVPVLEMPWSSFPKLFPDGEVFKNEFTTPVEKILEYLSPPENVTEKEEWMFKNANFDDTRLPPKEQIIGVVVNDEVVAFTKEYLKGKGTYNTTIGNENIVIAWHPEYNTFTAFSRSIDGQVVTVSEVDVFGNSDRGKLERVYLYNSVLWAVWAHYYPETKLIM